MSRIGLFGQISEINDHLYLSGAGVLQPENLKKKKITCVVNATNEEPSAYLPGIDYLKIRIDDNPYAHLDHYFDMVADRIRSVKERGGRTLVHCMAGVSRSASLCIVYLIKYERMSLVQAYHFVKSARPIIRPNIGFFKQMVDFERKTRGHTTVAMVRIDGCDMEVPDIYANELRRHAAYRSAIGGASRVDQEETIQRAKSAVLPLDYGKRRGLSVGNSDSRYRYSASKSANNYSPWRQVASLSLLSPAPARRPRQENLFSNLYNSSRGAFFSAF
ncbi:unnamed protein product [Bursaphelenchus xylophilus]|uniref:(pine wood nematode) hypothetical protein n=1 Tax=Bursaphelenchus xylophilus TaxID=6326 RepID=A0A811K5R8_BURXY|nr:unnamed protein product [Bursaphelenchus xylophilus]CAG9088139.1 unnamed protein product [Bursaphelenchus xylophilus]